MRIFWCDGTFFGGALGGGAYPEEAFCFFGFCGQVFWGGAKILGGFGGFGDVFFFVFFLFLSSLVLSVLGVGGLTV